MHPANGRGPMAATRRCPPVYDYRCPGCGTEFRFRQRATLRPRVCSACGLPIRPSDIDRQKEAAERRAEAQLRVARRQKNLTLILGLGGASVCLALVGGCCLFAASLPKSLPAPARAAPAQAVPPKSEPAATGPADDEPATAPQRGGFGKTGGSRGGAGS